MFEPTVIKTVATEPFIRCPECGMCRALNSDVWNKDAKETFTPPPTLEETKVVEKVTTKKPEKKSTKKSKKK